MKLQKAVKQETKSVAIGTGIGCVLLIALFLVLHLIFPESTAKVDYRVVLGALCGGAVAVANFFLMAITVQNVVNVTNRDDALRMMRVSYRNRMLMRTIWIIVAIFAPCFNYAAGIIPLFIPSFVIKIRGIRMGLTGKPWNGDASPDKPSSASPDNTSSGTQEGTTEDTGAEPAETGGPAVPEDDAPAYPESAGDPAGGEQNVPAEE